MTADLHDLRSNRKIGKAQALLHSLVPRAQCFCFYDEARDCVWSSDGADDHEIDNFVADLPDEIITKLGNDGDVLRRTLSSGRTVLALPVRGDGDVWLGMLVALFSRNAGKSASFNPSLLKTILEPAVEVLGESLSIGAQLERSAASAELARKELELVYAIDEKVHGAKTRHSGLARLVGQSGRFLGINYSVLLIPSKRIRISATHSTWKNVNRKVVDRYLVEQLLPKLEGQRQPVVFQIPAIEGSDDAAAHGYQALLSPLLDNQGNVEGILAQLGRVDRSEFTGQDRRFMAHIVRKVEYVIEQSFDTMTGCMNRIGFEDQLHESGKELKSADDAHQLIYFDLDNLQLVNDTFGREAGDAVIMRFARLLEEGLPKSGVLSRLTGDDFCILLTHADTDTAYQYALNIREQGHSLRYLQGDRSLQVTMSVGIAEFSRESGDEGSALTTARMACEAAKDHGRDRIEIYDDRNLSIVRRYDDMQLVAEIQQALDADGFDLLAQPIESLTGMTDNPRFEVLLRMADVDGVRVPTKALFSAAERYRMMPQIDRWVVSRTIAAMANVRDFVEEHAALFSINLSGQSLGDDEIFDFIDEEIRQSGMAASCLCFEITESAAVSNLSKAQAFIDRLRDLGCGIALDDFGAGLSSFAYLKNFQVDALKIDGGFIRDITDNRISESMVAAITQVAKVMQLETVAEYVESEKIRTLVTKLGVDFAQGHVIGKPEPIASVLDHLSQPTRSSTG
ncbi:MAG: EAL domain-containing protein [Gammaproteobacteria bacterium]|nr:EAL domain-containing protein [Gammaproteobacteria bacterium]